MITKPNTVLVASALSTTTSSTIGTLVVLNAATGLPVADATDLSGVDRIQFGVIKGAAVTTGHISTQHPAYIAKTKSFSRDELRDIRFSAPTAETDDTFTLTLPAVMPAVVAGDVLHVRMYFKVDGHVTQKSEEYVFDLTQYTSTTTLATDIAARINTNGDAWVTAVAAANVITIEAKRAIDFQPNAKSITAAGRFNQVEFDLASFKVNGPGAYYAFGDVVKTVNAGAGIGNPYSVRDEERDALGYLGAMWSPTFPNIQPASSVATVGGLVNDAILYASISFTAELKYRAPDESYMKSTGVSAQMYVPTSVGVLTAAGQIVSSIQTWAGMSLGV